MLIVHRPLELDDDEAELADDDDPPVDDLSTLLVDPFDVWLLLLAFPFALP